MSVFDNDSLGPDPEIVRDLTEAIGQTIAQEIIPNVTTQADVISALFTMLHRILADAQKREDAKDHDKNAKEIERVLLDFLLEFGTASKQH